VFRFRVRTNLRNITTIMLFIVLMIGMFQIGYETAVMQQQMYQQQQDWFSQYLQKEYGVSSIEELRMKYMQQVYENITAMLEQEKLAYQNYMYMFPTRAEYFEQRIEQLNETEQQLQQTLIMQGTTAEAEFVGGQQVGLPPMYATLNDILGCNVVMVTFPMLGLSMLAAVTSREPRSKRGKQAVKLLCYVMLIFAVAVISYKAGYVYGQSSSSTIQIEPGSFTETASYIIYGEDTNNDGIMDIIYAKNGLTGEIDFRGTDAATVIQAVIDALTEGGKILIKRGVYIIAKPIYLKSNIMLMGEGWSTVLKTHDAVRSSLTADAAAGTDVVEVEDTTGFMVGQELEIFDSEGFEKGVKIRKIEGNKLYFEESLTRDYLVANDAGVVTITTVLKATGVSNVTIKDIAIDGNKEGNPHPPWGAVDVGYLNGIYMDLVTKCIVERVYVKSTTMHSIVLHRDSNDCIIHRCVTEDTGRTDSPYPIYSLYESQGGILVFNHVSNSIVANNICRTSIRRGIYLSWFLKHCVVIGNILEENVFGIRIAASGCEDNIIANNMCNNNSDAGISVYASETYPSYRWLIEGNIIYGGTTGISLGSYVHELTVVGNLIYNSTSGIKIVDSSDIFIGQNRLSNVDTPITLTNATNIKFYGNIGYVTENSGVATGLSNGAYIAHGLADVPSVVVLTCLNATYDGVPVIVSWNQALTNSTHIAVNIYWANGTAITDSVIAVSWYAEV